MLPAVTVFLISIATFFRNINVYPLRNWDEAWYAEIIKNMASDQYRFVIPFWNGQYYFDKPPLYFWLTCPIVKLFSFGEWQIRFISAAASVVATLLIYLIGQKLFGKKVGFISSLIFLTLGQVVIRFAHGNLDALLVCFSLTTFYFYLLAVKKRPFAILCGITIGLGFLTKGYFAGLFPAFLITIYSLITTKKLPQNLKLIIPSTIITAGWWYVLGTIVFGRTFIDWYILNPGANLLQSPIQSFSLSYFKDLIRDIGFWFAVVLISLFKVKKIPAADKKVLLTFMAVIFLFITPLNFLSEKLGWYNLPAYPLVAIIIGYFAAKFTDYFPKISLLIIAVILIAQTLNMVRIENKFPDRSKIGADLGRHAKDLIPKEDTVILDDHDFTSFLYYSDHKAIYMVQKGGGKPGEWWVLDYPDLASITNTQRKTWIITPNLNNLPKDLKNPKIENQFEGYAFISF